MESKNKIYVVVKHNEMCVKINFCMLTIEIIPKNPEHVIEVQKWTRKSGLRCAKSIPQKSARPRKAI